MADVCHSQSLVLLQVLPVKREFFLPPPTVAKCWLIGDDLIGGFFEMTIVIWLYINESELKMKTYNAEKGTKMPLIL